MKRIFLYTTCCLAAVFSGCSDFLEKPDASGLTEDLIFSTMQEAEKTLAGAYAFAPWGFPSHRDSDGSWSYAFRLMNHNTSNMSDEAHTQSNAWDVQGLNYYLEGTLSPSLDYPYLEDKWVFNYQAIRSAFLFYENVDRVKDGNPSTISVRKAEAKAFIATKQYENLKRYGGLAWVSEYPKLGKEYSTERLSIQQSVDSIINLLEYAIPILPVRTEGQEFGRINRIAAMTIKARTLLWSASPLFNPQDNSSYFPSYGHQRFIKHDQYDRERWREAAEAADAAIELALASGYRLVQAGDNGVTTPKDAYKAAVYNFPNDAVANKEIIWGVRLDKTYSDYNWGQWYRIPWARQGTGLLPSVYCTTIPLQNFVEMYELKSGADQPANLYNQPNPYAQLESRFEASMAYHGYRFEGNSGYVMDMSYRSNDDKGNNRPDAQDNFTGYYANKFIKDQEATGELAFHNVFWPYIRLAELYLMSAEAWNEYDPVGKKQHIHDMLNAVRNRGGQPDIANVPGYRDEQEYMREKIKRERAVELAFEEHRYFDLKRWKDGDKIGGQMYYLEVTGPADNPSYSRRAYRSPRVFNDRDYLYPIPINEIRKSDLIQNPGW